MSAPLSAYGLQVTLPDGWDGRIYMNDPIDGATTNPVVHISTFPLPPQTQVGDYGNGAIDFMGPTDVFLALVEFNQELAGEPLFQVNSGLPRPIEPVLFDGRQMQRPLPGFGGLQLFFNEESRAFCLYAVVGSMAGVAEAVGIFNPVLDTIEISARP